MLTGLEGVRVYAVDLLGSGWSDKPFREEEGAQAVSGRMDGSWIAIRCAIDRLRQQQILKRGCKKFKRRVY
jgi:pimeloyl-ACP methyl ester carboxylesterase